MKKSNLDKVRDIGKIKDEQGDVKRSIEAKKDELGQLKENKSALRKKFEETLKSDMSDDLKEFTQSKLNEELDANSKKGQELSREMNDDVTTLEKLKENVNKMLEGTENERGKLESQKNILEKFGGGKKSKRQLKKWIKKKLD